MTAEWLGNGTAHLRYCIGFCPSKSTFLFFLLVVVRKLCIINAVADLYLHRILKLWQRFKLIFLFSQSVLFQTFFSGHFILQTFIRDVVIKDKSLVVKMYIDMDKSSPTWMNVIMAKEIKPRLLTNFAHWKFLKVCSNNVLFKACI